MKLNFLLITLIVALIGMFGCEKSESDNPELKSGMGTVVVSLTDAPFPYEMVDEANITIDWIKLHRIDSTEMGNFDGDGADSVYIVFNKDTTINLLELSNGIKEVMSEMDVPAGIYNEIRIHVTEASIKLVDDSTMYRLKIPSGGSSGIKVKIKPWLEVEEGSFSEVLLDVDVNRSFKILGNAKGKKGIKGFMFKPVIRAVNLTTAGKVEGYVTDIDGEKVKNAIITLLSDTDTISTSKSAVSGFYAIIGVPEGTYSMECTKEDYNPELVSDVVIEVGKITQQDFVLTE